IRFASRMVVLVELALAATVWIRPAWRVAAPLGLLFHAGILFSKLEIGLFAWLMIAIYVLVVPDAIWIWLAETPPMRVMRDGARAIAGHFAGRARWLPWLPSVVLAIVLAAVSRFDHALAVAIVL